VADQNVSLTDFEEGVRRALEWLGRSEDGAELPQIVGERPTNLGDMESAFLVAIGRAALAGHKAAPQTEAEATALPATLSPSAAAGERARCEARGAMSAQCGAVLIRHNYTAAR
jgi:hypothetical protein